VDQDFRAGVPMPKMERGALVLLHRLRPPPPAAASLTAWVTRPGRRGRHAPPRGCCLAPEGCKLRIRSLNSGYAHLPRSPAWVVQSRSCSSTGYWAFSGSAQHPTRRTWRSPCSATSRPRYAARWHGLGTPRPVARCSLRWPDCSAVSGGRSSSSPRRPCCAGTGTSSPVRGPIRVAARPPTLSRTTSSPSCCALPGRTRAGASAPNAQPQRGQLLGRPARPQRSSSPLPGALLGSR